MTMLIEADLRKAKRYIEDIETILTKCKDLHFDIIGSAIYEALQYILDAYSLSNNILPCIYDVLEVKTRILERDKKSFLWLIENSEKLSELKFSRLDMELEYSKIFFDKAVLELKNLHVYVVSKVFEVNSDIS